MPFGNYLLFIKQNKYIYSLIVLIVFYILSQLVAIISRKVILKLTRKTKTEVDDLIIKKTNKPISLILLLIGIRLALLPLGIEQNILDVTEHIIASFIIILVTYIVIAVFDIIIDNWAKRAAEKTKSTVDAVSYTHLTLPTTPYV